MSLKGILFEMKCDCLHDNRTDAVLGEWVRLDHSVRWMILVFYLTVSQIGENLRTDTTRGTFTPTRRKSIPYPFLTQDSATDF
jgi:hypothetical protein